jgi:hypothetical protein
LLRITYARTLLLLRDGVIKAEKVKGSWVVSRRVFESYRDANNRRIEKLKAEYVGLYWQGLNPTQLQRRVQDDFASRKIVAPAYGFAEQAIYESLMNGKKTAAG